MINFKIFLYPAILYALYKAKCIGYYRSSTYKSNIRLEPSLITTKLNNEINSMGICMGFYYLALYINIKNDRSIVYYLATSNTADQIKSEPYYNNCY